MAYCFYLFNDIQSYPAVLNYLPEFNLISVINNVSVFVHRYEMAMWCFNFILSEDFQIPAFFITEIFHLDFGCFFIVRMMLRHVITVTSQKCCQQPKPNDFFFKSQQSQKISFKITNLWRLNSKSFNYYQESVFKNHEPLYFAWS